MRVVERAQMKNVKRLACNEEYECMHEEVNRDLHENILIMKEESVWNCEVGSSFLDIDGLMQIGCFLGNGVHLLQEEETKLSQRYICWIKIIHLLMEDRMHRKS
ncbi:hypothetical protein FHG87_016400 [Trinorchestia longiramus]|nr:hypothetical protein FHG87_016400 [Trinorchestia longiramus]